MAAESLVTARVTSWRGGGAMLHRRLAAVILAAVVAIGLVVLPGAAAGAQDEALVRVAHFAPGLLKGDVYVVYVNGRLQLKGVPFKTVSDYLKVKPGRFEVEVRKSGEPASSAPVIAATVSLQAGRAYTVAVFGQLTSVKAMLLDDDVSRPASGKSKVRLIQALPGDQAVDLAAGGDVLFSGAKFPSASDYLEVQAGRVEVEVRKAGGGDVLAPARTVNLPKGAVSSLVVVGGIGEKLELLDIRDSVASAAAPAGGVATGAGGEAGRHDRAGAPPGGDGRVHRRRRPHPLVAPAATVPAGAAGDPGHRGVRPAGPPRARPRRQHAGPRRLPGGRLVHRRRRARPARPGGRRRARRLAHGTGRVLPAPGVAPRGPGPRGPGRPAGGPLRGRVARPLPQAGAPGRPGVRADDRAGAAPRHLRRDVRSRAAQLPRQPGGLGHHRRRAATRGGPVNGRGERVPRLAPARPASELRILLVSRDAMLAEALESLVEAPGEVSMLDWRPDSLELALQRADVVVIDVPPSLHEQTFAVIDGRFLGRLVVLLQEGEPAEALPPGPSRVVLYRPLQIGDLWAAVTGAVQATAGAGTEAEAAPPPSPAPMIGMSGRELEPVIGPGQVAPGMDADTLERLRRWRVRAESAPTAEPSAERAGPDSTPGRAAPARRAPPTRAAVAWLAGRAARARAALGSVAAAGRVGGGFVLASVARAGAASARGALAVRGLPGWLAGLARPAVVVALAGVVGLGAAGWRGDGGPDLLAGEVASAQAAGSLARASGLLLPDPRVAPVGPVHALAVGAWLRLTGADTETTLEAAVRAARTPSRVLLAGVVVLTVVLLLLLMRVGPGTGAAAGPGPTPPHQSPPARASRLGAAAAAGLLAAADPLLVRSGRVAAGTALALLLALATLALAWAPRRPARLTLIGAGAGLALLASPLALPLLAVPVVAAVLERRPRPDPPGHPPGVPRTPPVARALAALGLGVALWTALPLWVAGQGLDAEQAGQLLGGPPGRGSLGASLAAFPLSWLLAGAGLAAAIWAWRPTPALRSARPLALRSARPPAVRSARPPAVRSARPRDARLLAWVATSGAGALVAVLLGWPVEQALPFALPAAAAAAGVALARLWRARAAPALPQASSAALAERRRELVAGRVAVAATVAVGCLILAQGVDWASRYGGLTDDGLGRLVGVVDARLPDCSAVNAGGPDDRARLLAAGVNVTDFTSGPAAQAAGVRYFVLTGGSAASRGGLAPPALARWVRQHGSPLADLPSPSLSRVQLWQADAAPLDPAADSVAAPGGAFSNVKGSACGGYRVLDND